MKQFIFLASLGFSVAASASVVKVIGTNCGSKKVEIAGSGVVFTEQGQQYLVTSEHVAPVDSKLCYAGVSSSVETSKMTLVSSDWEAGLALFKLDQPRAGEKMTLDSFVSPRSGTGEVVHAIGYASSEYGQINDRARVTTTESDRTAFVATGKNIEVAGVTNEHGLSGGALTDEVMQKVLGILSHQKIKARAGSSSELVLLAQNTDQDPRVLSAVAIPGDRVREWAGDAIHKNAKPNYSRDKQDAIRGFGLELKEKPTRSADEKMIQQRSGRPSDRDKDRKEILKMQGGDGVGIGGRPGMTPITLQISMLSLAELKAADPKLPEVRWISQLTSSLTNNPVINIKGMVVFHPTGEIELQDIYSAADFLRKLRGGNAVPLLQEKPSSKIAVEKSAADIDSVLQLKSDSSDVQDLFEKIKAIRSLVTQYPQLRIPAGFIQKLSNHPGLSILDEENFEMAVLARRYLLQLQ